jgi:putative transposase
MKLVANIQLKPTPEQAQLLKATLETCNRACNWIAGEGLAKKTFRQYDLQKLFYYDTKTKFNLSAQVVVRCTAKVADAYKIGPETKTRHFRPDSAQPYDDRIFRFKKGDVVSIWLLGGRQAIPFVCGERQRALLKHRKGEVDLMLIRGKWYVACVCDIPDPADIKPNGVLGVDLGIVNLAFDSDGTCYSGSGIEEQRRIHSHRRANLQKNGSKSAKRKLRKLKGKQAKFQKNTNHVISKKIVQAAQRSQSSIALEDLKGITSKDGVKARRRHRNKLHNWGFAQLRQFIAYKAKQLGIPLVFVNPRNTSRECPACHVIDKANRPSQSVFSCISCGHSDIADYIAAQNIRARAVINQPMVGSLA